jgi:membrane protease YdiL (CAAX protease family)
VLVIFTAIIPTFLGVGEWNVTLQAFLNVFILGLVLTLFSASILRDMLSRRTKRKQDVVSLGAFNAVKQITVVLPMGILLGLFAVMLNGAVAAGGNLLLGTMYGAISQQDLYLCLLAGCAEELFFRGFLQTTIEIFLGATRMARFVAIVPVAIVFSLYHFFAYNSLVAFIVLFVIGMVFGLAHALSNDIGVPMLAHVTNNCFAALPLVAGLISANIIWFVLLGVVVMVGVIMAGLGGNRK